MKPKFSCLTLALALACCAFSAEPASDGKGAITDPKQVLAGIPREVMQDLRYGSRSMEDAAVKATAQTRKNVEGKAASLKMTVQYIEKFQRKEAPDVTRIRLRQSNETIREGGATFSVFLMAVMDESEMDRLSKIDKGSKVTVTGKISNAEILARKTAELHIDIMDAKLE